MELNDKVTQLEDEIKILKNEVQAVLLDLRESFLNNVNPFNPDAMVTQTATAPARQQNNESTESQDRTDPPANDTTEEPGTISENVEPELEEIPEEEDDTEVPVFHTQTVPDKNLPAYDDFSSEQKPDFVPENRFTAQAPKEVNMVWHPDTNTTAPIKTKEAGDTASEGEKPDLEMISELATWVEASIQRLGPKRTRTILDITETMGYLDADLKNILVRFIHPSPDEDHANVVTKDYLFTLVELSRLLKTDSRMEVALLFILIQCQEYDNR